MKLRFLAIIPLFVLAISACANPNQGLQQQPNAGPADIPVVKELSPQKEALVGALPGSLWTGIVEGIDGCQAANVRLTVVDYLEKSEMVRARMESPDCPLITTRLLGKIHPNGMFAVASAKKDRQVYAFFNLTAGGAIVKIRVVDMSNPFKERLLSESESTFKRVERTSDHSGTGSIS